MTDKQVSCVFFTQNIWRIGFLSLYLRENYTIMRNALILQTMTSEKSATLSDRHSAYRKTTWLKRIIDFLAKIMLSVYNQIVTNE